MVFDQTPGAIFILDKSFRFEYVNPSFERLSGYSKEELLNKTVAELFYHNHQPESRSEVVQRLLNGEKWQGELLTYNKNGTSYWANTIAAPYVDDSGNIEGYVIIQHDISEKIRTQQALRESEAKYKTLVENSQDGIIIVRDNHILFANDTICNVLGYCIEGLDLISPMNLIHPDDQHKLLSIAERRRNNDFSTINEHFRMIANGGAVKECETLSTLIEFEGQWASFFTIHDVTDSKRMQIELKESESKYKTLIENSQDGIFAIINDRILFANNTFCKMVGYSSDELYNKSAVSLVLPDDRTKGLAISERRRQGDHSTVNDIFHFMASDGSIKEADVFSSVLELNGQQVSYITVHDLTETRKIQEQLKQSEEKYRSLIENATDGIVIVQNGLLKFANQTMCDIMKYKLEELIEKPFLNYIDEKDHALLSEYHARRMVGEQFSNILRSRFIRKDGKMITVELNARTSNYNGSPAGFIIIRDITERLKIEIELQTAKNKLELLNSQLEKRVKESSESLTEARTQLINLQKENLQSQFDVLKQQVNPHFLFNSLNVLTSLIKLEPDLAEKFSEQLSKVYRYVLENKDNELVDLNTELNFLDAYIFLLNIRFVDKLRVNITISDAKRNSQIIPLAMQLLIENAIKHNIMSKSEPLNIDVFVDSDNYLNIVNNLQERPSQLVSTGVGLKNIQNRYLLLNNSKPVFEKTDTHFIAKVPLVSLDSEKHA